VGLTVAPPEDLLGTDPAVQKDVTCFELGLLVDRNVLIAAVLNQEVVFLPRRLGVSIDADGRFQFTGVEAAVLNEDSFYDSAAGPPPKLERNPRVLSGARAEVEVPA
jgi:hypothetical protein